MTDAMIRLEHVSKTFPGGAAPAVGDLSFEVPEGEILVLVGPSGCGKTTTLKMINRIVEPTSGRIWVAGTNAIEAEPHLLRRQIGYVIQQTGLFPHRTIAQNIATVPRLLGWDRFKIDERVVELIDLVGLDAQMSDRYPAELSGGQQQRVGVARALAADPPVLLMDEPFGAVDPIVRTRLQIELLGLQARVRKTIVFVTHDIDEAIQLGDRVAILNVGGVLEQIGPPEEILREPVNDFVAEFLGTDRGLKRLSLIPIHAVDLDPGPVVAPGTSLHDARSMAERYDVDWVGVGKGADLLGWLYLTELESLRVVPAEGLRRFRTRLDTSATLKEALDAIVSSRAKVAAVFDGDRYLGMLTADRISDEITQ
ncbi:MAG: ATP-binding cassette domain-containing protein [Acidimicrobiia bacterium]|nr:ATP-binding cassette domain-containing protein [Acidimicrobiia bacterium]